MLWLFYLSLVHAISWNPSSWSTEQQLLAEQVSQPVDDSIALPEEEDEMKCGDVNLFMKEKPLRLYKEWEFDGHAAKWAPSTHGGPLLWGEELRSWPLPGIDPDEHDRWSDSEQMAVSADGKFVAIATNKVIHVYTMADKEQRAELVGHMANVGSLEFAAQESPLHPGARYTLFSQAQNYYERESTIIAWPLGGDGKLLSGTKDLHVDLLADKAITAITPYLDAIKLSEGITRRLRKDFIAALSDANRLNQQKYHTAFNGSFPGFGSRPLSEDGKRILYTIENESTQSGMRPEDKLPQIVVRSLVDLNNSTVLKGHTDAIMWASFSPTDPNVIASAAWDGSYRIWDVASGTCTHTIRIKGEPQNWSGHFSPDGKHILLSGTYNVALYSVSTGEQVSNLSDRLQLADWVRSVSWSSAGDAIALGSGNSVVLWEPFGEKERFEKVVQWTKEDRDDPFEEFRVVKWLTSDVLAAQTSEASWLVWDRRRDVKWRFQRPVGTKLEGYCTDSAFVKGSDGNNRFVSLDADLTVREWLLV